RDHRVAVVGICEANRALHEIAAERLDRSGEEPRRRLDEVAMKAYDLAGVEREREAEDAEAERSPAPEKPRDGDRGERDRGGRERHEVTLESKCRRPTLRVHDGRHQRE